MVLTDGEVREVNQKCETILARRAAWDGAERLVADKWFPLALAVKCGRFDLVLYTCNYVPACMLHLKRKKQDRPLTTEWSNKDGISHFITWGQSNLVCTFQADVSITTE